MKKPVAPLAALLFFLLALAPDRAFAHTVYLFAWEEGERICTSSYYSRKNKVREGEITVLNGENNIAEGITDSEGKFCFHRPAGPAGLTIVLNARQGHRATYDFSVSVPASPENDPAPGTGEQQNAEAPPAAPTPPLEAPDTTPTVRDIIGGLGWIVGIFAIAALLKGRKRH